MERISFVVGSNGGFGTAPSHLRQGLMAIAGNQVEELRSFLPQDTTQPSTQPPVPASPERENRLTWKPNGLPQMRLPNT